MTKIKFFLNPIFQLLVALTEMITGDFNDKTRNEARSLLGCLTRFDFVVALVITTKILGYMKSLSTKLQGSKVDVISGYNMVKNVQDALQEVRLLLPCIYM